MSRESDDLGTIQVLLDSMVRFHLPRTLEVKRRIDEGELLTDMDIDYLHRAFEHAWEEYSVLAPHPEYRRIMFQLFDLYEVITERALQNEQASNGARYQ